jgi:Flp pilus assembly protein CpaB
MKKQNRRQNILAVALGLILGFYSYNFILSQPQSMVPRMVPVVVADADITPGTVLRPEILRVVQWPEEIMPPHTAKAIQKVQGLMITVPVIKGEPILLPKLVQQALKQVA